MSHQSKFPRVREIMASPKCSLCDERSIVTAVIQRSAYRKYHDQRLHLCPAHYSASGAAALPLKAKLVDGHDRAAALLDVWLATQEERR